MPGAFEGLAAGYERWRPRYPPEILDSIVAEMTAEGTLVDRLLVDVGTGTGISARLLREAFGSEPAIVAIDPEADMLRQAREATPPDLRIFYQHGRAEQLPLLSGTAALVLAAQAIQWFDRPAFLTEARRVLEPAGILAVLQNDRDWRQGGLAAAYEEFLETHSPGYTRHYRSFYVPDEIKQAGGFGETHSVEIAWVRTLSTSEFVEMAFTSSKTQAAVRAIGEAAARDELQAIAERAGPQPSIPYATRLYWARSTR